MQRRVVVRILPRTLRRFAMVAAWLGYIAVSIGSRAPQQLHAQEPAANNAAANRLAAARLVTLPVPITDNADNRFRGIVNRLLTQFPAGEQRPTLVIRFDTGQSKDGAGTDFHRANGLAEFLTSKALSGVKTVAYLPKTVKGHAVLVAMACQQIVMAPDAELGEAGIDDEPANARGRKSAYQLIADAQKTVPAAIALGMLDKEVTVIRAVTDAGTEYVLSDELEKLRKDRNVQSAEPLSPRPGLFSGKRARLELGFVSYNASDIAGVAKSLGLPEAALLEDPSLDRDWQPIQVTLRGEINDGMVGEITRLIDDRVIKGTANFVCVRIESEGGRADQAQNLANYLANLDPSRVRTVAYVPEQARGFAAVVALACDELVMHRDAVIGGEGGYKTGVEVIEPATKAFRAGVAAPKSKSWSLGVAMFDPNLKVYRYDNKHNGLVEYWCEDELKEQPDPTAWRQGPLVSDDSGPLQLSGDRAADFGVAQHAVGSFAEFKKIYSLENDPALVDPSMTDRLLKFMASPGVSLFLLLIGGAAVYAELQTPGVGLGGMIAFICFLLYFWAKFFEGTAGALEVLLFVSGMVCLILEIFVLPGMGIFGLAGGIMVIVSLVLASQTFVIPQNDYQLEQMRNSMLVVGGAAVGMVGAITALRRYLPHAPLFNRMMLAPPSAEELEELDQRESLVNYDYLLGRYGTAVTQLTPSGKAQFGDTIVDVITAGDAVDRDANVVVIEVRGNRVVVGSARA